MLGNKFIGMKCYNQKNNFSDKRKKPVKNQKIFKLETKEVILTIGEKRKLAILFSDFNIYIPIIGAIIKQIKINKGI